MKRTITLVVSVLVLGLATPAYAHYVYSQDRVWQGGASGFCYWLSDRSEISDGHSGTSGNPLGFTSANADTWQAPVLELGCAIGIGWNRPAGHLAAKTQLWKYSKSHGWGICRHRAWKYSNGTSYRITQRVYWERPCGHGWYAAYAGAATVFNSDWKVGWLWSGSHYL